MASLKRTARGLEIDLDDDGNVGSADMPPNTVIGNFLSTPALPQAGTAAMLATLIGGSLTPSFGSDTTVQLANAGSTLVNAWRGVMTLTNNTPAAEASKWLLRLLTGGAAADTLSIEPSQLGIPDKLFWLGEPTTFINRPSAGRFEFTGTGSLLAVLNPSGLTLNSIPLSLGGSTSVAYNGAGSLVLTPGNRHVQICAAGVLATNSVGGFPTIPTCAGTPTGVPANVAAGHAPYVIDTTGGKLWGFYGGAWHDLTGV